MSEQMFAQVQDAANHYNPNTDFELNYLPVITEKCKPSSFEQISTIDSPQTLLGICVLENGAHKNRKSEFHKAGGVFDSIRALFKALWDSVGKSPELNAWFTHFNDEHVFTREQKQLSETFARLCKQSYREADRLTKVRGWVRYPDFDNQYFSFWVNESDREAHIACIGPKLNADDLWNEFDVLLGNHTSIAESLEEYIKAVCDEYRGWLFSISGHSMGAHALLEMISKNIHPEFNDIYLFNCPPYGTRIVNPDKRFHMYLKLGEPIGNGWAT